MNPGPLSTTLKIASGVWLLHFGFTAGSVWALSDEFGISHGLAGQLGIASVVGALILYCGSFFLPKITRVIPIMMIGFLPGAVPWLISFGFLSFAYFFLPSHSPTAVWAMRIALVIGTIWWCMRELRGHKRRIIDKRFIEREFSVEADRIVVRRPQKTDLSPPPVSDKTFLGRLYGRFGGYLIMLIPLAYPIQRIFSSAGGLEAVLLLVAVLGTPLMLYILGRMTCGAYLWIYKVWQLEREHGKPVVFADVEA